MRPLEITTILQLIDAHRTEAHDIWKSLLSILSNRDEPSLYQYIHTFLQGQGFTTRFLGSNPQVLYSEIHHETAPRLLCYTDYTPEAPASPQAQAITASLFSLIIYRTLLAARADINPITQKWVFSQKNFFHTLQFPKSIEQKPDLFHTDACLWYEPLMTERTILGNSDKLVLATGTKGYLSVELHAQTTRIPLHSSYGAIVPNAAWRLLWALNSLKDQREEIVIEGFYDTMTPLEDEAFQQLANLPDTASTQAARWGLPNLLMGLQGKQLHYAHILAPTCTINSFISGEDTNTLVHTTPSEPSMPTTARAVVDFYLVPGQDPEDIFTKLKKHLLTRGFSDIEVTLRYAGSPAYTPASNDFVKQVVKNAERVYKHSPILLPLLPEYVPVRPLVQNPPPPVIILPLYTPKISTHTYDEQQALRDSIAHLTSIMLHLSQHVE